MNSRNQKDWVHEVEEAIGSRILHFLPVAGGDVAASFRAECADGSTLFLKRYATLDRPVCFETDPSTRQNPAQEGIAFAEADGLRWLAEADAIQIPEIRAVGASWLALEWVEVDLVGPRSNAFDERLGRRLAALHSAGAPSFGYTANNWIGRLEQRNAPTETWTDFYSEERIAPLARLAASAGLLTTEEMTWMEKLREALPDLVGPAEPPARLHGDLWQGNCLRASNGVPCLIDPAVYGGHREVDLAMMKLFGGFSARVFEAYEEAFPLAVGAAERTDLYQVYPLLVHLCLFGRSYAEQLLTSVRTALGRR